MHCQIDEFNSYASAVMMALTLYRNQPGLGNKLFAQFGYAAIALGATAEAVMEVAQTAFTLILFPLNEEPFHRSFNRLQSSSFCAIWALFDFVLNPFYETLVADEESARRMCRSGDYLRIPPDAVV
jgi:hypothetical protein